MEQHHQPHPSTLGALLGSAETPNRCQARKQCVWAPGVCPAWGQLLRPRTPPAEEGLRWDVGGCGARGGRAGARPQASRCRSSARLALPAGSPVPAGGHGGNGLITHFLCILHLNNNAKAKYLKRAGQGGGEELPAGTRLIKIEPRHSSRCQLPWMAEKRESKLPSEGFTPCLAQARSAEGKGWKVTVGAAGGAQVGPHLAACPHGQELLCPRLSPCIHGGPSSGTAGGSETDIPSRRAWHRAASCPGSQQRAVGARSTGTSCAGRVPAPAGPPWGVWEAGAGLLSAGTKDSRELWAQRGRDVRGCPGRRAGRGKASWQEGARKDVAELGWAKPRVVPVPEASPTPRRHRTILPKADAEQHL